MVDRGRGDGTHMCTIAVKSKYARIQFDLCPQKLQTNCVNTRFIQ